jgi:NADPH:quinone reductase-like Zn-dependent oxidoreductase
MQAVVAKQWGGPEVLEFETVPDPAPEDGQVLVELRASALNWHDVLVRRTGRGFPLPSILGIDGAGVRRDTGEAVVLFPVLNWGDAQIAPGPDYSILGDIGDGTYAELISVPAENVFPKPAGMSWEEAAALPVAGLTAYRALFSRAQLQAGETVLIQGAGSGVSALAVSLAAAAGARVVVTSSDPEKLERSREIGADEGLLYTDENWIEELLALTGGGVDVVMDGVGSDLAGSLKCLKRGGRLSIYGASGGFEATLDVPSLYFSYASIFATGVGSREDFAGLLAAVEEGKIHPAIDSVRPLAETAEAHRRIEESSHFGKLVLSI